MKNNSKKELLNKQSRNKIFIFYRKIINLYNLNKLQLILGDVYFNKFIRLIFLLLKNKYSRKVFLLKMLITNLVFCRFI